MVGCVWAGECGWVNGLLGLGGGACWCLVVVAGACWCLLVPVGACWYLLVAVFWLLASAAVVLVCLLCLVVVEGPRY